MHLRHLTLAVLGVALLAACNSNGATQAAAAAPSTQTEASAASAATRAGTQAGTPVEVPANAPFTATAHARFNEPWAMTFLPDGRLLVTEKPGDLRLVDLDTGAVGKVTGVPEVAHGGQGGFGDIALAPDFADNHTVYFSYAEAGDGDTRGAAVATARLDLDANGGGTLNEAAVIWRQVPKVTGRGHFAHRLLFSPDGQYLFISSGDRQKFDPAQDMASSMGKILRLHADGSVPADNPFAGQGDVAAQVWTLGHRNPLGIAFDAQGRLWNNEMGPKGGDELNLIVRGENYGYPIVSNGDHYDGTPFPDHDARPEFKAPVITWTPVISPSSLLHYTGALFPRWQGNFLIGGLSSQSLVRVQIDGERAREVERYVMGKRIRAVQQGPDGAVWLLEDGEGGRLLKLLPKG
ncbi:MAG: PQQ-dependent sugar dehydrogenase [Pseudoxanthomonas suwonensis]|nr:PQQ-dependent sugar dehydrogenase [Pseudoxanthomonas suwonensis]